MNSRRADLADATAAAQQLLASVIPTGYVVTIVKAAECHPDRPTNGRGLCRSCYAIAWLNRTHANWPAKQNHRSTADFAADFAVLRDQGYTRHQIAERLGMRYPAVNAAYRRAVHAGLLEPDRRTA